MDKRGAAGMNEGAQAGPPDVSIREMVEGDLADGTRLTGLAGWNQTERDWRVFLRVNPEGCLVAVRGGRVVGTIAAFRYGLQTGWISMVLVDPEHRRQGIGTLLMRAALDHLKGCAAVRLDATPAGKGLYDGLGFRDEWGLARLGSVRVPAQGTPRGDLRPLGPADLDAAAALDEAAFGAPRRAVLQSLREAAPQLAWQIVREKRCAGFCLGRAGARAYQVGPVMAQAAADAVALAGAALRTLEGRPVVMDVPDAQAEFREWLRGLGFEVQRPFTRMRRPQGAGAPRCDAAREMPAWQFAIAGPEFG